MLKFGIDLGGTKIEGAVLSLENKILFRERIFTEQNKGYDHILAQLKKLYFQMQESVSFKAHTLGIGTPGSLSKKTNCLKNSNTLCLNGRLNISELEIALGHVLKIQNDANCFALAESMMGAGRGYESVFGVIMGTGCGGGFAYQGKVIEGPQSLTGEWGHMSIDPLGPDCYCGRKGCVETWISGGGAEKRYFELFHQKNSFQEIVRKYRNSEEDAVIFMNDFFERFGFAVANLINMLDPEVIVLGGGVSNVDELYTKGVSRAEEQVFNDEMTTRIIKNELGDSAGVLGAALIGV